MSEAIDLHIRSCGEGPDLVMLHGWGMHGGVWEGVAGALSEQYRVHVVDLPGHGRSAPGGLGDLDALAAYLRGVFPGAPVWMGWSLGGMIAQDYARRYPQGVSRLITVAANARFTRSDDWPHAVEPEILTAFAEGLESDFRGTLTRFLALQFRGVKQAQAVLRELRASLLALPPDIRALREGLGLLRGLDLREVLSAPACPLRLILGERDTLVPPQAASAIQALHPHTAFRVIGGAGHAPFLSHESQFLQVLNEFLHD